MNKQQTDKTFWWADTYQMEQQLTPVVARMEQSGIKINVSMLQNMGNELLQIKSDLEQAIHQIIGTTVNINSNEQLSVALFEQLQLKPQITTKNKKGLFPVDKKHLNKIKQQHQIIQLLLDYRKSNSLLKFVGQLSDVHPKTKRIHAGFHQIGTATGRFSSSRPNLQNIPNVKLDADETNPLKILESKFREVVIPAKGKIFICADYSQIELRITAVYSQDPFLLDAYHNGLDIHTLTASQVYDSSLESITDQQRKVAKSINFGLIYGMTSVGLAESLTQVTGKVHSKEEAEKLMTTYFNRFSKVKQCLDDLIKQAEENGFSTALFGRRRPIPQLRSNKLSERKSGKRIAMNSPIQGTAADIIKKAMIKLDNEIIQKQLKAKIVLQVHDEILVECPKDEAHQVEKLVKETMENVVKLTVPLEVGLEKGSNWAMAH
ncbi:DNA polymerase [Galbibacter pacificus]|uniref:DNA-directed DNA polymerase n=1 Tax=Galbibacter pacificus TaxID=2996052 RepID=A0ABT6FRR1_9FLAO|nr:DNA polymerase [Galbibacter pacificus]MDG3582956.1 DNA polymerase [Galbibacter pacificus]MDG3585925.1 DNA polymerase [Galbibacter pacificus]